MFKEIADEHQAQHAARRQKMKELEAKIVDQSVPAVSDAVFSAINKGSDQIISNQKEIDRRCRAVRDEWVSFNRELERWSSLINDLDREIKSIGDVKGWSNKIQSDVQGIVEQLAAKGMA